MQVIWPPDDEIPRYTRAELDAIPRADRPAAFYLDGVLMMNFDKFDPTPRNYTTEYRLKGEWA